MYVRIHGGHIDGTTHILDKNGESLIVMTYDDFRSFAFHMFFIINANLENLQWKGG